MKISRSNYSELFGKVSNLLQNARNNVAMHVNTVMTETYWHIGKTLVEEEQKGNTRAKYGAALLKRLASDLMASFGRGFSVDNLEQMRRFYLCYRRGPGISETASRNSKTTPLS